MNACIPWFNNGTVLNGPVSLYCFCDNDLILILHFLTYRVKQWTWYKLETQMFTEGLDPNLNSSIYLIIISFLLFNTIWRIGHCSYSVWHNLTSVEISLWKYIYQITLRRKFRTVKSPPSEKSTQRKFRTAKIPYGEISEWRKFRTAKNLPAKIPSAVSNIPFWRGIAWITDFFI